jgi:hypothetical protein
LPAVLSRKLSPPLQPDHLHPDFSGAEIIGENDHVCFRCLILLSVKLYLTKKKIAAI